MRPGLRRLGTALFLGAAFLFLGIALVGRREQLVGFDWQIEPLRLGLATAVLIGGLVGTAGVWAITLRFFDVRLPFHSVARIWFLSGLGRYIPGKIWQLVGVAELGRAARIPPLVAVTSLTVAMGFILMAAWFVSIYLLPATGGPLDPVLPIARVLSPLLLLGLHPALVNRVLALAARLTRRPLGRWSGGWLGGLLVLASAAGVWLVLGLAFFLFVTSLTELGAGQFPALTAAFAFAFLAGYVVVIAPAGLGAKEGALTILLAPMLPLPVAAAIAVAARVWTVLAELLPVLVLLRPARRSAVVT